MTAAVETMRNRAAASQVAAHLRACDSAFMPPLSERVDVDTYAEKIVQRAQRFEAWSGGQLTGLVAAYCNDVSRQTAFITSVTVLPSRHGEGIARRLLLACIDSVREAGFERIELEVDPRNSAAGRLYKRLGFAVSDTEAQSKNLYLTVAKEAR